MQSEGFKLSKHAALSMSSQENAPNTPFNKAKPHRMLDEHLSTVKCLVILRHQCFTQHQEGEQNVDKTVHCVKKRPKPLAAEIKMPAFSFIKRFICVAFQAKTF